MKTNCVFLSRKITAILLWAVFYFVVGFSLFLSPSLTWNTLIFSLIKGIIAVVIGLFFYLIVPDSVVKAIMGSFADMRERRKEGGLLFHFIAPADNEILDPPESKGKTGKKNKGK